MKNITPWFTRPFGPVEDVGLLPALVERLAGAPIRLQYKVQHSPVAAFRQPAPGGAWTAQEHVGHLLDLEPLWYGRMQQIAKGEADLMPADLTNRRTHEANHNTANLQALADGFAHDRQQLVTYLNSLTAAQLQNHALHPRLKTPMRVMDLCFFVAEHDDHHLAHISQLITSLN